MVAITRKNKSYRLIQLQMEEPYASRTRELGLNRSKILNQALKAAVEAEEQRLKDEEAAGGNSNNHEARPRLAAGSSR